MISPPMNASSCSKAPDGVTTNACSRFAVKKPRPGFAYSNRGLEIMSPSISPEAVKSVIGRLVEVFCLERNTEFSIYGSWTPEEKALSSQRRAR